MDEGRPTALGVHERFREGLDEIVAERAQCRLLLASFLMLAATLNGPNRAHILINLRFPQTCCTGRDGA